MNTIFEEYFYHDVYIREISIIYNENATFVLEFIVVNEKDNVFKCRFTNIYDLLLRLNCNVIGNAFIINAFINNTDTFLTNFKNKPTYADLLNNINCFIIETSSGETIKILSGIDIDVFPMN